MPTVVCNRSQTATQPLQNVRPNSASLFVEEVITFRSAKTDPGQIYGRATHSLNGRATHSLNAVLFHVNLRNDWKGGGSTQKPRAASLLPMTLHQAAHVISLEPCCQLPSSGVGLDLDLWHASSAPWCVRYHVRPICKVMQMLLLYLWWQLCVLSPSQWHQKLTKSFEIALPIMKGDWRGHLVDAKTINLRWCDQVSCCNCKGISLSINDQQSPGHPFILSSFLEFLTRDQRDFVIAVVWTVAPRSHWQQTWLLWRLCSADMLWHKLQALKLWEPCALLHWHLSSASWNNGPCPLQAPAATEDLGQCRTPSSEKLDCGQLQTCTLNCCKVCLKKANMMFCHVLKN